MDSYERRIVVDIMEEGIPGLMSCLRTNGLATRIQDGGFRFKIRQNDFCVSIKFPGIDSGVARLALMEMNANPVKAPYIGEAYHYSPSPNCHSPFQIT